MRTLLSNNIRSIKTEIMNDECLNILLSQKRAENNHRKNIFNFGPLVSPLIDDYLIPFIVSTTKNTSHTFANFIEQAYIKEPSPSDTKERTHFRIFNENVSILKQRSKNMEYIPPFIRYITNSILPSETNRIKKQQYRNYRYTYFNARSYSFIMRNSNYLPFFQKDNIFTQKQCKILYELFTDIQKKPMQTSLEQLISQHYIDKYFNIHLFAKTLNAFDKETKTPSFEDSSLSREDYGCYLDYFLFLCTLLQESPSIYIKEGFFNTLQSIFFNPKDSKIINLFYSSESCFKQCASEIILFNKVIAPYIMELYSDKFNSVLKKEFLDLTPDELYKQFSDIVDSTESTRENIKFLSERINKLKAFSDDLSYTDEHTLNEIYNSFYNSYPFMTTPLTYLVGESYCNILSQISLSVELKFREIKINHFKNAKLLL